MRCGKTGKLKRLVDVSKLPRYSFFSSDAFYGISFKKQKRLHSQNFISHVHIDACQESKVKYRKKIIYGIYFEKKI